MPKNFAFFQKPLDKFFYKFTLQVSRKKKNKHQIQLLRPTSRENSPIQDYVHPDDHTQPTFEMTPGFKPFRENIQEFRSDGAWNVSFCVLLMSDYKVTKVAGPRNQRPDQGPSNGAVIFYDAGKDFRQRSEAVGLLQASYMLRQLTGKMSAHYSSSKIRNTHFRLFPPDQGPHTVQILRFLETLQTGYSLFLNLKCCFCTCSIELLFIFLFPYYWPFNNFAVRSLFSVVCLRRLYSR